MDTKFLPIASLRDGSKRSTTWKEVQFMLCRPAKSHELYWLYLQDVYYGY